MAGESHSSNGIVIMAVMIGKYLLNPAVLGLKVAYPCV
jgi:hypothetical protein